jgi:tripartite-type tricarboxylate transporter receptor subunit TctC
MAGSSGGEALLNRIRRWVGVVLGCGFAGLASAQGYPTQPIRLIVPWPPGGGVDTSARIISQPFAERLGQSIVIDNKPGAAGNIGTEQAARAKPDGYTLLMGSVSPNAINPHLYARLGFEPVKDFAPIALVASVPNVLVVPANSPFHSVQELVAMAKANPGKLNYGSGGVGSSQHLATEMFKRATGVDIVHVPYKGTAPAELGLMSGDVALLLDTTACLPFIAAGKMKALGVASKLRNAALPNVPTFDELGVPGVYAGAWYGVMAPAGTPREIVERLNREVTAAVKRPDVIERMQSYGYVAESSTPERLLEINRDDLALWRKLVADAGMALD